MDLKVRDGRGDWRRSIGKENRAKVIKWFTENPNSTQKECSEATGLSLTTIRAHINTKNKEEVN